MIDSTEYPLAFRTEAASVEREFDHLATQYILPPIFLCTLCGWNARATKNFVSHLNDCSEKFVSRSDVQKPKVHSKNFCCFENFKKIKKIKKKTEGFSGTDSAA